jgi:hypothetical protein
LLHEGEENESVCFNHCLYDVAFSRAGERVGSRKNEGHGYADETFG